MLNCFRQPQLWPAMHRFFYFVTLTFSAFLILGQERAMAQAVPHTAALTESSDPNGCWRGAAQYHGVDMWLLYSIAWVESRMDPSQVGKNKNGSFDMGLMQINTIWLPELAKYGIQKKQLMDSCTSIYVGAWILADSIRSMGPTWRAIGAYNAGTKKTKEKEALRRRYANKIYRSYSYNLRLYQLTASSSD